MSKLLPIIKKARGCACRPLELEATLYEEGTVPCVAFVSPDSRLIQDGLPPSDR